MGFHNKDGVLTTDGSIEEEIFYLCEAYPNMRVCIGHPRRAASAVVSFFAELGDERREKFRRYMDNSRWALSFENGSTIKFLNFTVGNAVLYPEAPVHIFVAYHLTNNNIIRNMGVSMRKYDGKLNHWHKDLFPMLYDKPKSGKKGYLFTGEDYYEEYQRVVEKVEYQRDVLGQDTFYRADAGFKPDISPYESAVEAKKNSADRVAALERELEELKKLIK